MVDRARTVRRVACAGLLAAAAMCVLSGCAERRVRQEMRTVDQTVARNDPATAYEQYRQMATKAEGIGSQSLVGHAYLEMAGIDQRQARYDSAEELQQKALEAFRAARDRSGEAACINEMGALHMAKGQYPEAEQLLRVALRMREELGDKPGKAGTLNELGSVELRTDRPLDARKHYEEALEIRKNLDNPLKTAETTHNIGAVYHAELRDEWVYAPEGDQPQLNPEEKDKDWFDYRYQKALEYYNAALEIFEAMPERDLWWIAQSHYQIGCVHVVGARKEKMEERCDLARESFDRAFEVHDKLRGADGDYAYQADIAWLNHSYGSSYHVQTRLREALEWYRKALPIWEKLDAQQHLSHTQHEIGGVYQLEGDVPEAIRWYKLALTIREDVLHDDHLAAYTYYEMGNTYKSGELAILCWRAALERAERPEIHDIHLESGCRTKLGMPQVDHTNDPPPPVRRTDTPYEYTVTEKQVLDAIRLAPAELGGGGL